ncbi:MAG: VWA domain-containing protein [Bacteroidia bacterium]|nr:VWA domain-containing protein [Bacteroidia bacterium]
MKFLPGILSFAHPEALLLLLVIPLYLFWYYRYYRPQRLVVQLSYDPARMVKVSAMPVWLRVLPRWMQLAAIALLIVALARPQTESEVMNRTAEGIDIMILLDISGSMEARDYPPTRLEAAKETAIRFIQGRKFDQIGLVLFANEALTYTPLTLDYDYLIRSVRSVSHTLIPAQGTAIGSAIAAGINRVRESQTESKVLILITDGAHNQGTIDPISAARLAASFGIRIYAIGIGGLTATEGNAQTALDVNSLKQVAELTQGQFFLANDPGSLKSIFTEISQLETGTIQASAYRIIEDHYPFFLQWAAILLAGAFAMMLTFVYNPLEQ